MKSNSRRGFFSFFGELLRESSQVIRPPYSGAGEIFQSCLDCAGECTIVCEEKIIERDKNGLPFLNFKISGCTYCGKCHDGCVPNVLNKKEQKIHGRARINTLLCVSHHETICFACKDPCNENAIFFQGMFNPVVYKDNCTACGFCVSVCPSGAIEVIV